MLTSTALPPVVDQQEWEAAVAAHRVREKTHTRAGDALAAERRRLPMVEVSTGYTFTDLDGKDVTLLDAFGDAQQLVVYHFMPLHDDGSPCPGCSGFTDQIGRLDRLGGLDTTMVVISNSDVDGLRAVREQRGWTVPFLSSKGTTFSQDMGRVKDWGEGFGLSVFVRDGDRVFRTYVTDGRGVEALGSARSFLDLTPMGRQEAWEDTPAGRPQHPTYG